MDNKLNPNNTDAQEKLTEHAEANQRAARKAALLLPKYELTKITFEDESFFETLNEINNTLGTYLTWAGESHEQSQISARHLAFIQMDVMDGIEFEGFVSQLLETRGFETFTTPPSGDLGIDILATKDDVKYVIQVKRHGTPISRQAVSDAVAGREHYGFDIAMVITNNQFSSGAKELAESTRCRLVDRGTLETWIIDIHTRLYGKDIK